MTNEQIHLGDIHWLMEILQNIDVGLVVLDQQYNIQLWNAFMESHSGISPQKARGQNLFQLFPDIPQDWLQRKTEPVFQLRTRAFICGNNGRIYSTSKTIARLPVVRPLCIRISA